ncbi:DUF6084 family protein [Pseudonocardia hispaniensis]|uniref:DUF6084 family protein n=1 Tax=Pseudonocardia hispaniensis TaxID=904933 RepID=A0ABW1J2S6_9PSEU
MLRFACTGSRPEPYAAGPSLQLDLRVTEISGRRVHTASLRVQIRIDPRRRRYTRTETDKLADLFGATHRWGDTLNPLQLATVGVMLPSFTGSTTVPLNVPLTYDLDVAAGTYFHALEEGEVPLLLLFSGTLFYAGDTGVQVGLVPWHEEAEHRLPVTVWRAAMDEHFPGCGWVRLRRETIDALLAYRSAQAVPTWDETIERLLKVAHR